MKIDQRLINHKSYVYHSSLKEFNDVFKKMIEGGFYHEFKSPIYSRKILTSIDITTFLYEDISIGLRDKVEELIKIKNNSFIDEIWISN